MAADDKTLEVRINLKSHLEDQSPEWEEEAYYMESAMRMLQGDVKTVATAVKANTGGGSELQRLREEN